MTTLSETPASPISQPWRVSLLAMFLVFSPMLVVYPVVLLDHTVWGGVVQRALPMHPEQIFLWSYIFNFPHIVASLLNMADREYVAAYRWPLFKSFVIAGLFVTVIPLTLGTEALWFAGALYTMYHVLMQQYGLSLMLMRCRPDWTYQVFRWLSVAGTSVSYWLMYKSYMFNEQANRGGMFFVHATILVALVFGVVYLVRCLRKGDVPPMGTAYFCLNLVMLAMALVMLDWGYPFFVNIIPRIAHDFTAFVVYVVHDRNRNTGQTPNLIYQALGRVGIGPALGCVVASVVIAGLFTAVLQLGQTWIMFPIIFVSVIHYYIEGILWKHDTLHRRYVKFA